MPLTREQLDAVVGELKQIGADLNLTDEQKQKLQAFMTEASEKVQEYKQQNPSATREEIAKKVLDNRAALRQRLVNFLTPEQLAKWDTEVAKAKEFLGHKIAA
jgi:protein CpxP